MKSVYGRLFYYIKTHGRHIIPPSISEGLEELISGDPSTKLRPKFNLVQEELSEAVSNGFFRVREVLIPVDT